MDLSSKSFNRKAVFIIISVLYLFWTIFTNTNRTCCYTLTPICLVISPALSSGSVFYRGSLKWYCLSIFVQYCDK